MRDVFFSSTRIAVEHDGRIAMAKRTLHGEQAGMYEIFGGKIESNETPFAAAIRETQEEMGKELVFLSPEPLEYKPYEIDQGKHAGKRCKIYGFAAVAATTELTLDPAEHIVGSEIWVPPHEIESMPGITQATAIAMRGLKHFF